MRRRALGLGLLVAIVAPFAVLARVAYRGATTRLATLDTPRVVADRTLVSGIEPLVDVAFVDGHQRSIHGWFHPGTRGATVLLLHGFGASRDQLAPEMRLLAGEGYGFLAYDAPGHGESDGTTTWGDTEQDTLLAAVDFVSTQSSVDTQRLGALGFSLGGAAWRSRRRGNRGCAPSSSRPRSPRCTNRSTETRAPGAFSPPNLASGRSSDAGSPSTAFARSMSSAPLRRGPFSS